MFLTTSKFKFLDVKNYIGPGLSYDAWCKSMGCRWQKLMFPYEWLDSCKNFYSSLKSAITRDEYEQLLKLFKENDCTTMGDWLQLCNVADVVPFIKAFRKMAEQYYPDKIDACKDAVSIPGISMTSVLNKSLEKNKKLELGHLSLMLGYMRRARALHESIALQRVSLMLLGLLWTSKTQK